MLPSLTIEQMNREAVEVRGDNTRSLQAVNSRSCGHYVLMYFNARAKGQTFQQFLNFANVHN